MGFWVGGEVYVGFDAFEVNCLRDADGCVIIVGGYGQQFR